MRITDQTQFEAANIFGTGAENTALPSILLGSPFSTL